MKDIYELMVDEDVKGDLEMLRDVCGLEALKKILRGMEGISLYIPRITGLESLVLRYIKSNPDRTFKQIARDLNDSDAYIRKVRSRNMGKAKKIFN